MPDEVDFLIPNKKAAALLGVCPRTLFSWVLAPDLNFPRPTLVRGRRYFSSAEIQAWRTARQNPTALGADRAPNRTAAQIIPSKPAKTTSLIDRSALEISEAR
jgi:hypothetical protein